jgi:hypothetical protein
VSLVDITYTDVPHRMRVASVIRGDTTIMLSSDSRDVSADFSYSEGHGPGLEPDVIVADALSIPVPQSMRAAVARPTTTPPQSWPGSGGSGSASSDPGVAALPSCEISSMYVTIGPGTNGDTPGQRAFAVHLNYHGSTACRVSWPPTLTLTASDTLAGVAVDGAGRVPQSLPPTRFSPGDSATFTLSTSTCAGVVTARTVFVAIGLPGSSTVVGVVVPWDMGLDYCDGATTPGDHVSVSSLVVGTA